MATLSAGVQRAGGSVQHPMGSLDDALEFMAAYVEARAGSNNLRTSSSSAPCMESAIVTPDRCVWAGLKNANICGQM